MRGKIVFGVMLLGGVLSWSSRGGQNEPVKPETVRLIESIQGPALYKAYCAACHGIDGKGAGPVAPSLKIRPSDLTRIAARNGGAFPMARVERIISGEEQVPASHGTREMPLWGPIFAQIVWDQDLGRVRVDNLARYLKDLQTK